MPTPAQPKCARSAIQAPFRAATPLAHTGKTTPPLPTVWLRLNCAERTPAATAAPTVTVATALAETSAMVTVATAQMVAGPVITSVSTIAATVITAETMMAGDPAITALNTAIHAASTTSSIGATTIIIGTTAGAGVTLADRHTVHGVQHLGWHTVQSYP